MVKTAKQLIEKFSKKILLPEDVITEAKTSKDIEVKPLDKILKGDNILDIGPKTRLKFYNEIIKTDKLLWNGPLGYFEKKPFDEGTGFVVKAVKNNKNKNFFSVAGGGDTISLLKQVNAFQHFLHPTDGGVTTRWCRAKRAPHCMGARFLEKTSTISFSIGAEVTPRWCRTDAEVTPSVQRLPTTPAPPDPLDN